MGIWGMRKEKAIGKTFKKMFKKNLDNEKSKWYYKWVANASDNKGWRTYEHWKLNSVELKKQNKRYLNKQVILHALRVNKFFTK